MKTATEKLYEAMFLIDSALAAGDWEGVNKAIKNILKKAKAEIVSIKKWDERKLAYEINGQSRGTYILCYFRADGQKIAGVERDVQLSEKIMRVLILNTECLTEEDIEKDTPATHAEKKAKQFAEKAAEAKKKAQKKAKKADEAREAEQKQAARAEEKQQAGIEEKTAEVETAAEDTSQTQQPQPAETEETVPTDKKDKDKKT